MKTDIHPLRKKLLTALGIVLLLLTVFAGVFFWYVSDYYKADDAALELLAADTSISTQDNLTILPAASADTALIFYPGAKVEAEAYLPLLDQIRQEGITCILVHMPFHMAIFDSNAAAEIIPQFPQIHHWYVSGHSMGGAMASHFASEHPGMVDGLILMGAYLYGDYPLERTLTIYGSLDGLAAEDIDYTTNTVKIEGGNHAQFGDYGPQDGDLPAAISVEEQQRQTVDAITDFLEN